MQLSSQDKKQLERYTRNFMLQSAQVVVQARLGRLISTPCDPKLHSPDTFNINIVENVDVTNHTKAVFGDKIISDGSPMCIQVMLKNQETESWPLEYWIISMSPEKLDPSEADLSIIHRRFQVLLTSVMSLARQTPAYRLSMNQSHDTYIILYKVTWGAPPLEELGENHRYRFIGEIPTPIGGVQLAIAHRTDMTLPSGRDPRNTPVMLKDDHFNANVENKNKAPENSDVGDLTKQMRPGPFSDGLTMMPTVQQQLPEVSKLLGMMSPSSKEKRHQQERKHSASSPKSKSDDSVGQEHMKISADNSSSSSSGDEQKENTSLRLNAAVSSPVTIPAKRQGQSKHSLSPKPSVTSTTTSGSSIPAGACAASPKHHSHSPSTISDKMASSVTSVSSRSSALVVNEEYFSQEVLQRAPFSSPGQVDELMEFYKDLKERPPYPSPPQQQNPTPDEINQLISEFESKMPEFDEVVQSLCDDCGGETSTPEEKEEGDRDEKSFGTTANVSGNDN